MKALDRLLQRWRIRKVCPYVRVGDRVLDIGCADAALRRQIGYVGEYIGIDPDLDPSLRVEGASLLKGFFPAVLPDARPFDVITMLAVLEHVPADQQTRLAENCARYLKPGGYLLITVPSPFVDRILDVMKFLHLVEGIAMEEHYGFDAAKTRDIFAVETIRLVRRRRFQLGLNNLFIFQKESVANRPAQA